MSPRLSLNLMGEFSSPSVMSLTGTEEGDSGTNTKALLSRCATAGTQRIHTEEETESGDTAYGSQALSSAEQ